jgi:acyl-CoA thioesterase-1
MELKSRPSFSGRTILLAALLLQGCAEPKLSPVPIDGTVLAFGDSLTLGVGADQHDSYPNVLSELGGRRVINAGVSGETTDRGLARLRVTLPQVKPDLLLLLEGGNDILRSRDPGDTKHNLSAMVEFARAQGVEVVLVGVPDKLLFSDSASFYGEIAQQYDLVFDDETLAGLLRRSDYKSDAVHLNSQGYRVLAEAIHELLAEHGAL